MVTVVESDERAQALLVEAVRAVADDTDAVRATSASGGVGPCSFDAYEEGDPLTVSWGAELEVTAGADLRAVVERAAQPWVERGVEFTERPIADQVVALDGTSDGYGFRASALPDRTMTLVVTGPCAEDTEGTGVVLAPGGGRLPPALEQG